MCRVAIFFQKLQIELQSYVLRNNLPIMGAKRQEFPMNGSSFGPGTSEYDFAGGLDIESFGGLSSGLMPGSILVGTSFGKMLIADE